MSKIIFEFSETIRDPDDITINVKAMPSEVLFATTVLINSLADNKRKETGMSKGKAIEQVLATAKKVLEDTLEKQENRRQTMGDIK